MKHVLWLIALVVFTLLGDRLGGSLLNRFVNKSHFRYSQLYKGEAKAQVAFLGNSRGLSFCEPYVHQITGRTSFNLSYNAMPMDLGYTLFRDYLERNPAPQKLIIEVSMCGLTNKELVLIFGCYAPFSRGLSDLITAHDAKIGIAGQVINLLRYNGEVFQRTLYYLNRADDNWLANRTISPGMLEGLALQQPYRFAFASEEILRNLVKTVKLAQQRGIDVKLVLNPYLPAFAANKIKQVQPWKNAITAATGLPVADYSRAIQGNEFFTDYQHLNLNGSLKYISLLKKDAILD
ncbi:hypothetical protein [Spirosoma fluviale]|uniref:SGNH/GDSL hydrolase family protein n=1 Tax=Spirosoma fluviale TaxID=1597977 RepID=A0A286GD06_9BACT|nr:hypothetical protein [Spirosoma fluviale]SOD93126.1 hypothetical protein SAMN06269250_4369 [Spirosoma fluviale]